VSDQLIADFKVRSRYFTPSEAEGLLPEARELLDSIQARVEAGREILERARAAGHGITDSARHELDDLQALVDATLRKMGEIGVEVKGLEPRLLDFPALRHGEEVYLCWREGELGISWWHPVHTGVAGRQALEDAESGAWEWCN
jgi:hypothetical protein